MRNRLLSPASALLASIVATLGVLSAAGCRDQVAKLDLVTKGNGTAVGLAIPVADRLYLVPGGGGNTAVFLTKTGVTVVDPKYASSWPALEAAIRRITDAPITHVIATHSHSDHAEAVVHLPGNAKVFAQANTLERMMYFRYLPRGSDTNGRAQAFADRLELFDGSDAITLMSPGPAHTNGDAVVYFHEARTLHVGDLFPSRVFPVINLESGGNGLRYPEALRAVLSVFPVVDHIITGHDGVLNRDDLAEFASFMQFTVGYVAAEMRMFRDKNAVFRGLVLPERFGHYDRERQFNTLDEIDRSIRPRWQRVF